MTPTPESCLASLMRLRALESPDEPFIIHEDETVTCIETLELAGRLAALFRDMGLQKGDLAGIFLRKTPLAIASFIAASACGAAFFPLDPNQPPAALRAMLTRLSPRLLFTAREYVPLVESLFPDGPPFPLAVPVAFGETAPLGAAAFRLDAKNGADLPEAPGSADEPVYLNLTSGTTGESKCAVATRKNLYFNTVDACRALGVAPGDRHLCMMPIFVHPHELFARPLYLGGSMVLTEHIAPKHVAGLVTRHKVNCFMAVASIYETLARLTDASAYDFSSLRVPESGGMHVTAALVEAFSERFGQRLLPVWGSTEAAGVALATPRDEPYQPGSCGKALDHIDARIMPPDGDDDCGEPCETGALGELVIEGPAVTPGYYGKPSTPADPLHGGRFRTGDIFRRDEDGFFHFLGRRFHMMKVGGMKAYPAEIEEALRAIPEIAEAAVIPAADALRGEVPKACIVLKKDAELTASDIRRRLESLLHRHKIPRRIEFLDELPRTPGGKIAWRKLSPD